MRTYRLVSADDHVNEPKDTWQARVPSKLRERAPKVVRTSDGDAWVIDGKQTGPLGLGAQAGRKFEDYRPSGETYETIRKGAYDPHERLKDMEIDGVDAQVIFPNTGLSIFALDDLELQFACLRAYNDFLSDFCKTATDRLIGIGLVPTDDINECVHETERISRLGGLRGVMLPTFPRGEPLNSSVYDRFWATAQDLDLPVHCHLGVGDRARVEPLFKRDNLRGTVPALLNNASVGNYEMLSLVIFAGVFELFPKLRFVSVEGNIGWLGYFLEKSDRTYRRHRFWTKLDLPHLPSEYFHRNVYATFIEDKVGIRIRDLIGLDNVMWSSDYPHTDTTWPNSLKYIEETFQGVPEEQKQRIIAGNAVRLYGLD